MCLKSYELWVDKDEVSEFPRGWSEFFVGWELCVIAESYNTFYIREKQFLAT